MTKFTDLDQEHKAQLLLNLRVQSLLIQYIAQSEDMELGEVVKVFTNKAHDVFELSSAEIDSHVEKVEKGLQECINAESRGTVKINLN